MAATLELYSFGTYSKRHAAGWLTYRNPAALNNILGIYPEGYIPRIHVYDEDFQVAGGLRGKIGGGIHVDLSTSYAQDEVKYAQTTSLNPSMGPASPDPFLSRQDPLRRMDQQSRLQQGARYRPRRAAVGRGRRRI
ncbi:hypothetical protein [Sphingobium yanoikuyae]|uniref:hypothetical protein n=1 Tax=Sphingobium yanoikuyae TaxID=13690 RepID=UPI00345F1572